MKGIEVIRTVNYYRELLEARGVEPERIEDSELNRYLDGCAGADRAMLLRHLLWICWHLPEIIDRPGGYFFCLRWIGHIEGALVACGLRSVEEVREQIRWSELLKTLEDELDALPRRPKNEEIWGD